jgi:hypothetical protein
MNVITCTYNDIINEKTIVFHSDASQSLIDSLGFNGEWCIVKEILLDWGYKVIEQPNIN